MSSRRLYFLFRLLLGTAVMRNILQKSSICFIFALILGVLQVCNGKKKDSSLTREFIEKERRNLQSAGIECTLKKLMPKSLDNLRLTKPVDAAIPCYLKAVEENINDGWFWSALASLYKEKGSTSQASTSFKAAAKILGKISPFVENWHFVGPFVIGKMELDGDLMEPFGGVRNVSKYRFQKHERFYSELVPGGEIKWSLQKQSYAGQQIKVSPNLNWNDLVSSLGSMGITEWQGWIVGEFAVNEKDLNLIVQCLGVHTVYIDDIPLTGDVYHRSQYWTGVHLSQGLHTVYIRLRTKVVANFAFSLQIAKSTVQVHKPHFMPDLIKGKLFSQYVSFPVSNYHHSKWTKITKASLLDQDIENKMKVRLLKQVSIAPGQTLPIILKLIAAEEIIDKCDEDTSYSIEVALTTSEGTVDVPFSLKFRCRNLDQSFLFTFIDHDGSLQQAAAIRPIGSCGGGRCPVVLSLHGTTVPPQNQADSYKRMVSGQFVFGVDNAWLLAPTRHGAHNWEGPGSLTALQAVEALHQMVDKFELFKDKVDETKIIFAGHSMGGHGAWHLATHFPDRALALISLAGWIKKEEYGDSNLFFRHDIATSHVDPVTKYIMESCIAENDADRHVSNIQEFPVLSRIGAEDKTVHPFFLRRMYRLLNEIGVMVNHTEIARKEHWWWDTWETNDGGAVNDPQLRDFTNKYISESLDGSSQCGINAEEGCGKKADNKYVQRAGKERIFTLTTFNPAFGDGLNGVKILQQISPFRKSEVKCSVTDDAVSLITLNVAKFSLKEAGNRPVLWSKKKIEINGKEVQMNWPEGEKSTTNFCVRAGVWESCGGVEEGERGPQNYGPARRVAEREFVIVVGTQSPNQSVSELLVQSAVYIANLFFLTSDTSAPIVKDVDIDTTDDRNLILLGGPKENLHAAEILDKLPFTYDGKLELASCTFQEERLGFLSLAPHGSSNLAMLLFGASPQGLLDAVSLATPTIPPMTRSPFSNLLPDYVVTGPDFGSKGPGGFLCTGFYGNRWEYRTDMSSCICL